MTCKHHYIRTWVFEDTGQPSGLWSCVDCSLKFEPITQRTWVGLTDEEMQAVVDAQPLVSSINVYFKAIETKLKEKNT